MEIEFRDKTLALVETDRAPETHLPLAVINSLRDKLIYLRAAADERSWINKQFRLIFTIDTTSKPNKMTILRVWNHD
jgi:plasmid maintenance system killer protein